MCPRVGRTSIDMTKGVEVTSTKAKRPGDLPRIVAKEISLLVFVIAAMLLVPWLWEAPPESTASVLLVAVGWAAIRTVLVLLDWRRRS
jgi:hypothetical protein